MADGAPLPRVKPLLRGVSHEVAAYLAAPAALVLWALAPVEVRPGVATFGVSLVVLFAVSASYHRPTWRPRARDLIGRLDHSAIFLLIAGTATPFGLILGPGAGFTWLKVAWAGALLGVALSLAWPTAPKPLMAAVYVLLGWSNVPVLPAMVRTLGPAVMAAVLAGGLIYTAGALVYARKWPDPFPRIFGYHEIFHLCVIVAAVLHFAAVAGAIHGLDAGATSSPGPEIGMVKAGGPG
jgi:hemolysin III